VDTISYLRSTTLTTIHMLASILLFVQQEATRSTGVTPPELASANPVESLAIHPDEPTCDQLGDHPCKIVRVDVKEGE
jgi:hypothetical protein